jgi:hypothetical protein
VPVGSKSCLRSSAHAKQNQRTIFTWWECCIAIQDAQLRGVLLAAVEVLTSKLEMSKAVAAAAAGAGAMARSRLEAAVAERDAQLDELGTSLRSAKEECGHLGEQVQRLSTKLSTMRRRERASSGSPVGGVSSGEGTPRKQAEWAAEDELTSEIATASAQRDALCEQCATLRATVEELTAQMAHVAEEREAAAMALADSRVDAEDAQERAHELLEQLDAMQQQQIGTCPYMTPAYAHTTTTTTFPPRRMTGLNVGMRFAGLRGSDDGACGGGAEVGGGGHQGVVHGARRPGLPAGVGAGSMRGGGGGGVSGGGQRGRAGGQGKCE